MIAILLLSCKPSAPSFRFSPRPNRAAEIHWRTWGPEIFKQKRPIFLSLSAIWCHWCHVLDETSLSEPRVIERLNRDFLPVRVDADQHPDVERRYILGGWPTVAVLTPDGQIVDGGTYLPPDALLRLLEDGLAVVREGGPRLLQKLARYQRSVEPRPAPIAPNAVENVSRLVLGALDPIHGGFGHGTKFPQADAVELLMDVGEREPARQTLDAMLKLEDPVEGGFYRYATRPDWTAPHYEKMLAVQAQLIALYAKASKLYQEPRYLAAAQRASAYVRKTLFDENTGDLWASQDADETYYTGARGKPPYVDRTLLVDRAAQMVHAWSVLGEKALAQKAAARLLQLQQPDGLFRHGENLRPFLADQVYAARALLPFDEGAAQRALSGAKQRWTCPTGALYDGDGVKEGRLENREQPLVENALFAKLTGEKKILEAFGGSYLSYGMEAASWALAVGKP